METKIISMDYVENSSSAEVQLEGHKSIIRDQGEKGFSYAGFVPSKIDEKGKILSIDFIFQKQ